MDGAKPQEVEVKLRFPSAADARDALQQIGAREVQSRLFEDNVVLDRTESPLGPAGKLLRLRRYGDVATLTFKAPVPGTHRHKVREEHETPVADFDAMMRILQHLGFAPCYRYRQYVLETYRELHVQAARECGEEPGDLVFDGRDDK